jgi:hypothetical protein
VPPGGERRRACSSDRYRSDLHELIERLTPEQAYELREHALRLLSPPGGRFKVLGPSTARAWALGAQARQAASTG